MRYSALKRLCIAEILQKYSIFIDIVTLHRSRCFLLTNFLKRSFDLFIITHTILIYLLNDIIIRGAERNTTVPLRVRKATLLNQCFEYE